MYFVAGALLVLSGILYTASNGQLGDWSTTVCSYGGMFCDNPTYIFVGAILAAAWARFVSIG
jgi:hypothetical protein